MAQRLLIGHTPTFRATIANADGTPYNPDTVDMLIERFTLKGALIESKQLARWPAGGDIVNTSTGLFDYAHPELTVEQDIRVTTLGVGGSIGAKKRAPGVQLFRVYPIPVPL